MSEQSLYFHFYGPPHNTTEGYERCFSIGYTLKLGAVAFRNYGDRDVRISYLEIYDHSEGYDDFSRLAGAISGDPKDLVDLMSNDRDLAWAVEMASDKQGAFK